MNRVTMPAADTVDTGIVSPVIALPALLSRLAIHCGHALPAHRFSLTALEAMGIAINEDPVDTAAELWRSAFPAGDVDILIDEPTRASLPLLWIPYATGEPLLVRGKTSSGAFRCEQVSGITSVFDADLLRDGSFLRLSAESARDDNHRETTRSARQWFLYAILQRRQVFIEALVATFVVSMLGLGASFYSLQVYDRVIPTQAHATLLALTVGVAIAVVFEFVLKQVRSLMVDRGCKAIEEVLSDVFFGRMLDIRMEARPRAVGSFAAQVRQFELVRNFMTSSTVFLIADLPFSLLFVAVIGVIGGLLATIPLLLLPLVLASSAWLNWRIRRLTQQQLKDARNKNGLLVDVIDGIESIKAAGAEWKMMERWRQLTASASALELDTRFLSTSSAHLAQLLQQLSYVAIIGTGAWMVGSGQISMGALIACSILSNRALAPITQIATLVTQWQHAQEALKGLDDMMALPVEHTDGVRAVIPSSCAGALKLDSAGFSFNGNLPALQPVTLSIDAGERIAIIGPVGSGKSTLIRLLSGLYRPGEGKALLDGVDMALLAPEFLHEQLGYLPQDVRLLRGTLRENLALGLALPADEDLLRAAALTGLDRVIAAHPLGLDLPIFEGGRGLSGGQRQLVGLTRLLIAKPRVLLLDEPTAAMDSELESSVMRQVCASLPHPTTMLVITHKANLLRLMDRVIVMDQGRVILDGPRREVLARLTMPATAATASGNTSNTAQPVEESR